MKIGTFTEYKGYSGSIEFLPEDGTYHGKLLNADNTLADYTAKTMEELYSEFKNTVNHYIEMKEMIKKADTNKDIMYYNTLSTLKFNYEIIDKVISNAIESENEEEAPLLKYNTIKSFAEVMKQLNEVNLNFIKERMGE